MERVRRTIRFEIPPTCGCLLARTASDTSRWRHRIDFCCRSYRRSLALPLKSNRTRSYQVLTAHCVLQSYGHTYSKKSKKDQPGKVANPARGQLNRENEYFPVRVRARHFGLARRVRQSRLASACSSPYSG